MRTVLTIDDELLNKAQNLTGLRKKSALVREALKALIEREASRRLALLGGSEPRVAKTRRRKSPTA
jgi:Arc/MetJ family transcription regulator